MTIDIEDRDRTRKISRRRPVKTTQKTGVANLPQEEKGDPAPRSDAARGAETVRNEETETPRRIGAKKTLRNALKAQVKAESDQIAATLVGKVVKGDMKGTQMMLSLLEKKKEETGRKKRKKRSGPSWAELLTSEPEWDESMENGGEKPAVENKQ